MFVILFCEGDSYQSLTAFRNRGRILCLRRALPTWAQPHHYLVNITSFVPICRLSGFEPPGRPVFCRHYLVSLLAPYSEKSSVCASPPAISTDLLSITQSTHAPPTFTFTMPQHFAATLRRKSTPS